MTTIIIIDDNKSIGILFQSLLENRGVKVVGLGYNGKDAIRLYQHHKPDVTFIDIRMPEYDGFFGIEGIRAINPYAKIIASTADTSKETQERLEKLKVSSILHKPFSMVTLEHVLFTELSTKIKNLEK